VTSLRAAVSDGRSERGDTPVRATMGVSQLAPSLHRVLIGATMALHLRVDG
jgi:hypothetical protein